MTSLSPSAQGRLARQEAILKTLLTEPSLSYAQVAVQHLVSKSTVTTIAKANHLRRQLVQTGGNQ